MSATKPREFWIQIEPTHCGEQGHTRFCTDFKTDLVSDIHVREVLPGSITLTRDEFDKRWEFCRDYSTDYSDMKRLMMRELFCEAEDE